MRGCPSQALKEINRDVAAAAVAQLDETAIRRLAAETPELFYSWCIEAFTAKRKAQLELEFQSALLDKLQRCDPRSQSLAAA